MRPEGRIYVSELEQASQHPPGRIIDNQGGASCVEATAGLQNAVLFSCRTFVGGSQGTEAEPGQTARRSFRPILSPPRQNTIRQQDEANKTEPANHHFQSPLLTTYL